MSKLRGYDITINKYNFYDKLITNLRKLAGKEWSSNNNTKFTNPNKFEE